MKRRNFLSTTSLIIATGATGLSAASSAYVELSSFTSLNEFSKSNIKVMDHFISSLSEGFENHPEKEKMIKNLVSPVRIIEKIKTQDTEKIIYKNRLGNYIKLELKNGEEHIKISDEPILN